MHGVREMDMRCFKALAAKYNTKYNTNTIHRYTSLRSHAARGETGRNYSLPRVRGRVPRERHPMEKVA